MHITVFYAMEHLVALRARVLRASGVHKASFIEHSKLKDTSVSSIKNDSSMNKTSEAANRDPIDTNT